MKRILWKYIRAIKFLIKNRRQFEPQVVAREALKFAPAKLQIEAGDAAGLLRWSVGVILLTLSVGTIWAAFAETEVIVHADGKCIPSQAAIPVIAPDNGRISRAEVADGQHVRRGQLLYRLETDPLDLEIQRLNDAMDVEQAHLKAITNARICSAAASSATTGTCSSPAAAPRSDIHAAYAGKAAEYLAKKRQRSVDRMQLTKSLEHETARLIHLRTLLDNGDATSGQVFEIEQICKERQRNLNLLGEEEVVSEQAYLKELSEAYSQHSRNKEVLTSDLSKAGVARARLEIYAAIDGTIQEVAVTKSGQGVATNQHMARIVPDGDSTHVEVYIPSKELARLRVGQRAKIKFEAIDFTRNGAVDGTIDYIGADAITDERKGIITLARIKMDEVAVNRMRKTFSIRPGMTAKVEFIVGSRTVLDYVLSPIRRVTSEALHEQ